MSDDLHGITASVAGYDIVTIGDWVLVYRNGVREHLVRGLHEFLTEPGRCVRLALVRVDVEIVQLSDQRDRFGYGLNLTAPERSKWGSFPLAPREANHADAPSNRRSRAKGR